MFGVRYLMVIVLALSVGATAGPARAADSAWRVDTSNSNAAFGIKHFALATVHGTVPFKAGSVIIPDGKDIPVRVEATLDMTAINTNNARRDSDLRSANWFDTEKYPTMTFKSTKISGADPAKFTIAGELTMHGITKPVTLEARLEGKGQGGRGEKRIAYNGVTTIHRKDFGLTESSANALGALVVGDDADVTISLEAMAE